LPPPPVFLRVGPVQARKETMGIRGEVFSVRAATQSDNRTYFFNVKENRNGDLFLNIVESKKHGESDFDRHQVVLFREDLESFTEAFEKALAFMKKA
jgi:hypothetical protein